MRKFRHEISKEIITFEELEKNLDYQKAVDENYKDEVLFADWLYCEDYNLLDIWEMDETDKLKVKEDYLWSCKEMAITDLDYEEIFE